MRAVCIERCKHGSEGGVAQSRPDSALLPYRSRATRVFPLSDVQRWSISFVYAETSPAHSRTGNVPGFRVRRAAYLLLY
jgi:hypothetical protein